ncbi:hypothetical protein COK29_33755, partial [Bacillus cereus]|uniref:hypothetical protein n=1 Tax=Bacillus cereus TaxID=1396 RepID=UPI000C005AAC
MLERYALTVGVKINLYEGMNCMKNKKNNQIKKILGLSLATSALMLQAPSAFAESNIQLKDAGIHKSVKESKVLLEINEVKDVDTKVTGKTEP